MYFGLPITKENTSSDGKR